MALQGRTIIEKNKNLEILRQGRYNRHLQKLDTM